MLLELPNTILSANLKTTSATSPSGSETSFNFDTTGHVVELNENFDFDTTRMIASSYNETNEMSGAKSMNMDITMTTNQANLSPVIDSR